MNRLFNIVEGIPVGRTLYFLSILLLLSAGLNAGEAPVPIDGGYAVVVSKATYESEEWKKVADALIEKYAGKLLVYDGDVKQSLPALKEFFPRYACFVARPEEAGRNFVVAIHRLTRQLDDDPYTDVVWGILTGYSPADALRIAQERKPLIIKKGSAGTGIDLNVFEEGRWFSEGSAGEFWQKEKGGTPEKKKGSADSTSALVSTLNDFQPDIFLTSGHATERDWQPGYSYKNGQFRCKDGKLVGLDLEGKPHLVNSANPKVYLGAGNCLIGNIPDKQCMALAWLGSGGANQMVGYTVVTWFGAQGWGTKDNLFDLPGRYTLSDAFFFANQNIVYQLESRFGDKKKFDFDKWDMERNPRLLDQYAQQLGYSGPDKNMKDHLGFLWDRDTVAFYGDPAWQARLAGDPALTTDLQSVDGTFTLKIHATKDCKPGRPLAQLLPTRVKNIELVSGKEFEPLVTDNFIMLMKTPEFKAGQDASVVFKAQLVK